MRATASNGRTPRTRPSVCSRASSTKAGSEARTLFWEHEGKRAVRRGDIKLVAVHGGPWELYDLATDRTELKDLAATRSDLVRELASLYDGWALRSGVKPWTELQTPIGGR